MEPTVKLETITPAIAKELLAKSKGNRRLIESSLTQITTELKNNNWRITGETIKIDRNGVPRDGFHRLQAVVKANTPIKTFVARGIEPSAVNYIDTGRSRSAFDALAIEGIENANIIAAMVKFIIAFNDGNYGSAAQGSTKGIITNDAISKFANKNKLSLQESMVYGHYNNGKKIAGGQVIAGLHFILKSISYNDADDFCHKLVVGGDLQKTSPIYVLRAIIEKDKVDRFNRKRTEKLALICKAWNLYRKDKKVTTTLSFNHLEEEFPKPI